MVNVQKHKLFLSLLLLTITGIFSACTDDTEQFGIHNGTPLDINVGVNTTESRAVITGNSLPDDSKIGVTVVDNTGTGYQDQDYNNVCYQAVTEDGSQKWKVQSRGDILLSGEAGTLYAYYPWSSAVSNIKQIAVNMDETDQKDWMVAQPVTDLSDAQATAAIKMQHMLSNFKLSFYKDNYSGKGVVTAVTIRSNGFATTATLDATTGAFTAYGDAHTLTRPFATTLGTDKAAAAPCNIMVVPNTVAAPVTVSVTVDGKTYSSVTSSLTLAKAKSYNYAMKLSSTGLNITEVTLTDWNTEDLGNTDFKPEAAEQQDPYADYVMVTYNITNTSAATQVFSSYPNFDIAAVDKVYLDENTSRAGQLVSIEPTKTYTFTTTGENTLYIKFKETSVIPNYAFYGCTQVKNVVVGKSLRTIGNNAFYNCTGIASIDLGEGVETINEWAFGQSSITNVTGGENIMVLGPNAFYGCRSLKAFALTNKMQEIGDNTFLGCYQLSSIVIPGSIKTIGQYAFSTCNMLKSVVINEGVQTIGLGAFWQTGVKEIVIPNSVTSIGANAFYRCGSLISVTLPANLRIIESSTFESCISLPEITIPETVENIGANAFAYCIVLKLINSLPTTAPTIQNTTFSSVYSSGTLNVPNGTTGYDAWMTNLSGWTKQIITGSQVISFNIGSTTYQAEEGMTWGQWVNSSYNTGGFYLEEDEDNNRYVLIKNDSGIVAVQGAAELEDDIISSSRNYQLYGTVTLPGLEGD